MPDPYVLFQITVAMYEKLPTVILCRLPRKKIIRTFIEFCPLVSEKLFLKVISFKTAKIHMKRAITQIGRIP